MTFKYSDKIFKKTPPTNCEVACEDGIRQSWGGARSWFGGSGFGERSKCRGGVYWLDTLKI